MKTKSLIDKGIRILVLLCVFLFINSAAFAQKADLTDEDVSKAVENGVKHKKDGFGLRLEDQTRNFFNAMANMDRPAWARKEDKGFSLEAYTPTTWISECAATASRQYIPFTAENVTEEMKAPVLYIIVHGQHAKNMGTAFGGASGGAISGESVSHVVLRSENKQVVIQPAKETPFDEGQQNAFGAKVDFTGVKVEFPLEEVTKLRSMSDDQEFLVTVVGENSEKDFKVKKKHFDKLP